MDERVDMGRTSDPIARWIKIVWLIFFLTWIGWERVGLEAGGGGACGGGGEGGDMHWMVSEGGHTCNR
jgi:hypothetical protein